LALRVGLAESIDQALNSKNSVVLLPILEMNASVIVATDGLPLLVERHVDIVIAAIIVFASLHLLPALGAGGFVHNVLLNFTCIWRHRCGLRG